jgi:hypothetical protein
MIVSLLETSPTAAGANVMFRIASFPGSKKVPAEKPLALKPGPEILVLEIVILAEPEFLKVTAKTLPLPTVTFPKFRFDSLTLKRCALSGLPAHPKFATVSNKSMQKRR